HGRVHRAKVIRPQWRFILAGHRLAQADAVVDLRHLDRAARARVHTDFIDPTLFQSRRAEPRAEVQAGPAGLEVLLEAVPDDLDSRGRPIETAPRAPRLPRPAGTPGDVPPRPRRHRAPGPNRRGVARPEPDQPEEQPALIERELGPVDA